MFKINAWNRLKSDQAVSAVEMALQLNSSAHSVRGQIDTLDGSIN